MARKLENYFQKIFPLLLEGEFLISTSMAASANTTTTIGKLLAAKKPETPRNLKSRLHYRHVS